MMTSPGKHNMQSDVSIKQAIKVSRSLIQVDVQATNYTASVANQTRLGILVDTENGSAVQCPPFSDDHLYYPFEDFNLTIDKKTFTVSIVRNGIVQMVSLDKLVNYISVSDLVGSVDSNGHHIVIIANAAKDAVSKKYEYKDSLGERFNDFTEPCLLVIDMSSMSVSRVDTPNLTPLKAIIAADNTIYFTAIDRRQPRVNGIAYCSNKPVGLYSTASDGQVKTILADCNVRSLLPRYDRQSFLYLQSELHGAHFKPCKVCEYTTSDGSIRTVCEQVLVGSVFGMGLPMQPFKDRVWFTTQQGFYSRIGTINVQTGNLQIVSPQGQSWSVVAVSEGGVVALRTGADEPFSLHTITLNTSKLVWSWTGLESVKKEIFQIHEYCEALLVRPTVDGNNQCIMIPHGGPNSNYIDDYSGLVRAFLERGFAVCRVNYTGSTGYHYDSIRRLIDDQQVGLVDISDCKSVADHLLTVHKFDKLVFYGGSHGGYIGAWLTARYPTLFYKTILVNPVITVWANAVASDIVDYAWDNLGLQRTNHFAPPTEHELRQMWSRSPLLLPMVSSTTSTLLLLGGKDLRVPPRCNGVAWWGWLRAAGWPVECLWFEEGDHGLVGGAEMERDVRMAVLNFIGD